jgi:hypothetical protein
LREDQQQAASKVSAERSRLETRLTAIRGRIDSAYTDKLDGKIPEDFWERKMNDWRLEEQQVKMAMEGIRQKRPNCSEWYRTFGGRRKCLSYI